MLNDASTRYHLVEFTNPSGALAWRVDGKDANGNRIRKNFATKAEAESAMQSLVIETDNSLSSVHLVQSRLTDEQVKDAEAAVHKLCDRSMSRSLTEVVDYFIKNWREPVRAKGAQEALDEFLESKRKENLRFDSVESLRAKCSLLVSLIPKQRMDEISVEALDRVIFKQGTCPVCAAGKEAVMRLPFEQQPRESAKAFAAFKAYLDMGPERSLEAVGQKLGKSLVLIERWSSRWHWAERVQAHAAHLAEVERRAIERL